jgi:PRC-barrel domain protein
MSAIGARETRPELLAHWAEHSHGYRVVRDGEKLGFVQDVIQGRDGVEGTLVVRGGFLGRRLMLVPLEDVVDCDPHTWRVVVRESSHTPDPGLLADWRRRRAEARREETAGGSR